MAAHTRHFKVKNTIFTLVLPTQKTAIEDIYCHEKHALILGYYTHVKC